MLLDSHIERRIATPITLGIPRWNKRINYYIFKIRYLQLNAKRNMGLPKSEIRMLLSSRYYNEYDGAKN
jgi:hypothetical protein